MMSGLLTVIIHTKVMDVSNLFSEIALSACKYSVKKSQKIYHGSRGSVP